MTSDKNLPTINKDINSLEDKRDHTQFRSKEEFAKDLEEAKKISSSPTNERGELYTPETALDLDERDTSTFNPENCQYQISPATEKAIIEYRQTEHLKSRVMYGNALSVGTSFATGSIAAILEYNQSQSIGKSLLTGILTSGIAGGLVKAGNYMLYERPLKKLELKCKLGIPD